VPNDHANDNSESAHLRGAVRVDVPENKDLTEAQNAGKQQINQVEAARTNRHSGSAGSDQELSIEIDIGDGRTASRINALTEASVKPDMLKTREQNTTAPQEVLHKPVQIGGLAYDPLSVFAKAPSDKTRATDATNAIAHKPEAQPHELGIVVGKPLEVSKYLEAPSPISDAVLPKKSPTLSKLVEDLKKLPWNVNIVFEESAKFQDYDPKTSTIHLGMKWNNERQIENFGHEIYHATHQDLDLLYSEPEPLAHGLFMAIKMDQEAGAFLAELKVNRELGHKQPTSYEYVDIDRVKTKQLAELVVYKGSGQSSIDDLRSRAAIGNFLREHHAPVRDNTNKPILEWHGLSLSASPYTESHERAYQMYVQKFRENQKSLKDKNWLNKGF
jgi:hypothetical protein